jgi:hypothetical protein
MVSVMTCNGSASRIVEPLDYRTTIDGSRAQFRPKQPGKSIALHVNGFK